MVECHEHDHCPAHGINRHDAVRHCTNWHRRVVPFGNLARGIVAVRLASHVVIPHLSQGTLPQPLVARTLATSRKVVSDLADALHPGLAEDR